MFRLDNGIRSKMRPGRSALWRNRAGESRHPYRTLGPCKGALPGYEVGRLVGRVSYKTVT